MSRYGVPATTPYSRVFLVEGRARGDHVPSYSSCLRAGGIDWSFGDRTSLECPDPDAYGEYTEVGTLQGAKGRPSTDLQGRYTIDEKSTLLRLAESRCALDIQVHFGQCSDPRDFYAFDKVIVYEKANLSNWSTGELGTLTSDGAAEVLETASLSARSVYELVPIAFSERGGDTILGPIVDVVISDTASCGDCTSESDGCEKIYALGAAVVGSPGIASSVIYSTDKGVTIAAETIDTLTAGTESGSGIAVVGTEVVVISSDSNSLHYKTKTLVGDASAWSEVTTGFVAAKLPNDIWSVGTTGFIVGDGGYIYKVTNPSEGVTVLDAGVTTVENLNAVHMLHEGFAVAVGAADTIVYTDDGVTWQAATTDTSNVGDSGGGMALNAVWVLSEKVWWVGSEVDANGIALFYTTDGGETWNTKGLPGTTWTGVYDINFPKDGVGYIAADKSATPSGYALVSLDGGYKWALLPQSGSMPPSASLQVLAACDKDVNFLVVGGTADDTIDGIYIVGS